MPKWGPMWFCFLNFGVGRGCATSLSMGTVFEHHRLGCLWFPITAPSAPHPPLRSPNYSCFQLAAN